MNSLGAFLFAVKKYGDNTSRNFPAGISDTISD